MPQFSDLTAEQQALYLANDAVVRATLVQAARVLRALEMIRATGQAGLDAVVATLDAGAVLPNATNYAGTQPLLKEQYQGVRADIDSILEGHWDLPTSKPLYALACGAANILAAG